MGKIKKVNKVVVEYDGVEVVKSAPKEDDVHGDVMAYLSGNGIVHRDAINVPHDKDRVEAVINHLKLTGKVNGDAGGRVWLA